MPLTDTAIKNAKPGDKSRRMADGDGLYLEVAPSGGKWWRLKYRYRSKEKRISLGTYPDVGLKLARERCSEARKLLAKGIDPSQHRKAMKAAQVEGEANSFEVVAREWFAKYSPNWSKNHADRTRAIQHYLGHKNIQHTVRYTELAADRFYEFWRD